MANEGRHVTRDRVGGHIAPRRRTLMERQNDRDRPGPRPQPAACSDKTAALVLGAAVLPGARPSPTLERRARCAAALWHAGTVQMVVGCGGLGRNPPTEAEMIARICRAEGLPDCAVRCESQSTNTLENIAFARPILHRAGVRQVVLVTDTYHAPRARMLARRLGLACRSVSPAAPEMPAGQRLRWTLREIPAWLYYRFRPRAGG